LVEVAEAEEGLNFLNFGRDRVLLNGFNFSWVHLNKALGYDKAEVFNGGFCKRTFFGF
jgi:hypothetical protein